MPKISQLPTLTNITTGSIIPVVESSLTQKLTVGKLFEFLSGALDQTFTTEVELLRSASSITSSFNTFASASTLSIAEKLATSSFNQFSNSVNNATASLNSKTGSYATTGSNIFIGEQTITGSILVSGSIIPNVGAGTSTSSFSLGSITNAWKDIYISHGSIIFVDSVTQETSSFTIEANKEVKYSNGITASYYEGDGSRLYNLPSTTNWNRNKEYTLKNTEQLTFSGDYILEDCVLLIEGDEEEVEYSQNKSFKREGSIFIGGNLLVKDSVIENNGRISVGGEVILIGNSQIVGTGKII